MSLNASIKDCIARLDARARPWAERSQGRAWLYEFLLFGLKQAWACLFGGAMLALILATDFWWPADAPLARYDALFVAALGLQALLLATRLERPDEALVILVFHAVGTAMEVFKTAQGSWIYPDAGLLRIGGVPLFSGFMYGAIGSFIARSFRLMDFHFIGYRTQAVWALALAAYVNFFTHHYVTDLRLVLFVLCFLLLGRTWIVFTIDRTPRRMPLLLGFVLVALFIWFAENIGTFAGAWAYPGQQGGWRPVAPGKLGAWFLLMMLSFALVTLAHRPRRWRGRADDAPILLLPRRLRHTAPVLARGAPLSHRPAGIGGP